ncbi:hypothetical protein [Halosolutus gelatinilyticus]|uniref:hypothetical protein n=1 Tax=Halosolutus gelatinilyticus TaxID=2931975 RepID=UPI001FF286FC|nr:hypothetical protein [Halosolutus gelatinilyticus]
MVAGPEDILPGGGQDSETDRDPLYVGDHVQDVTDDDDEKTMVVVEVTAHQSNEYRLEGANRTVADVNPEFDETDDVVEVVYPDRTTKTIDSLKRYAFPRGRLKRVTAVHDVRGE